MKAPKAGPKTRRSANSITGAITIIIGWLIGDVAGYDMPDHVLQAWTVVAMVAVAEWSRDTGP